MPVPTHLTEGDYDKNFPEAVDEFPEVIDGEHYIDAWLLNSAFSSLSALQAYLITWRSRMELVLGQDIIGDDGVALVSIPEGCYIGYKTAFAWDSNLLAENIVEGVTIFGVEGTAVIGGGQVYIQHNAADLQALISAVGAPYLYLT